jgi:T5SS/PEP-CTERM-associated repeat protein
VNLFREHAVINQPARIHYLLTTLALAILFPAVSPAVVRNWDGSSGSQFSNSANWTPAGVPDTNDTATFRLGNLAVPVLLLTPTFQPYNAIVDRLIIGTNTVTMGGGTMTVDGTSTSETARGLVIGETATDVAVLNMNVPSFSTLYATLGSAAGSSGTLNLTSTIGTFSVTGTDATTYDLIVGLNGAGTINVTNGRDVNVVGPITVLGLNSGSTGTVNVTNAGSTWTGGMILGYGGNGTLNVSDGGTFSGGLDVGFFGSGGNGTLNVTSGGTITDGGYIRSGTATVTGANSSWTGSQIQVDQQGTLNISNGGRVSENSSFNVGYIGGGSVHVASGGKLLTGNSATLFHAVQHGGQVSVTDADSSWINNGTLSVTSIGSINISAGGHFENNGDAHISSGGHVIVDGAGSRWTTIGHASIVESEGTLTVSNGGTIIGGLSANGSGTLKGNGSALSVDNDGIVAPGDSLGALHVNPFGYTQHSSGKLQIELGGTTPDSEYDQLLVAGDITLDGTLQVSLISPFSPAFGGSFNILDWGGTRTGQFATLDLPALNGALAWDVKQLYTNGVLSVILAGDYNHNGTVDAADYVVWRDALGQTGAGLAADGNGPTPGVPDGVVDQLDYDFWRSYYGQTAGSGSGASANAAVPEPATLVLLMLTAAGGSFRRRREA